MGSGPFFSMFQDYLIYHTNGINNILIIDDIDEADYEYEKTYMDETSHSHIARWKNIPKNELIEYHKYIYSGRYVGKFLIPEYAEYIGLTIDDLKKIHNLTDCLDPKHLYEKIIYDSYIENNGFYLKDEQRNKAYEEYKRERS